MSVTGKLCGSCSFGFAIIPTRSSTVNWLTISLGLGLMMVMFIFAVFKANIIANSDKIIFDYLFVRWWFGYAFKHIWFNEDNKQVSAMFLKVKKSKVLYQQAVFFLNVLFVYACIHKQSTSSHYLSICMEISKVYVHGYAMLGSLSIVYFLH